MSNTDIGTKRYNRVLTPTDNQLISLYLAKQFPEHPYRVVVYKPCNYTGYREWTEYLRPVVSDFKTESLTDPFTEESNCVITGFDTVREALEFYQSITTLRGSQEILKGLHIQLWMGEDLSRDSKTGSQLRHT